MISDRLFRYACLGILAFASASFAIFVSRMSADFQQAQAQTELQQVATVPKPVRRLDDEQRNLDCLARNIYHEARGERRGGQIAVAEVTMNRARTKFYGDACKAVYEHGAFSWTSRAPAIDDWASWHEAWRVARAVYHHEAPRMVAGSVDHYYNPASCDPAWAHEVRRATMIGHHRFVELATSR